MIYAQTALAFPLKKPFLNLIVHLTFNLSSFIVIAFEKAGAAN